MSRFIDFLSPSRNEISLGRIGKVLHQADPAFSIGPGDAAAAEFEGGFTAAIRYRSEEIFRIAVTRPRTFAEIDSAQEIARLLQHGYGEGKDEDFEYVRKVLDRLRFTVEFEIGRRRMDYEPEWLGRLDPLWRFLHQEYGGIFFEPSYGICRTFHGTPCCLIRESASPNWPCPYCGKQLRTPLAKQCRHCRRDWHDPAQLKFLGGGPKSAALDAPVAVIPYQPDWVRCSRCGKRFSIRSASSWDGERHVTCGQRLTIEGVA